jgi:protein TonB
MTLTTASSRTPLRVLRGWPLFIALSLLFHLLVLLLWYLFTPERVLVNDAPVVPFAVRIVTAPPAAQSSAPEQSRAEPPAAKQTPAPAAKPVEPQKSVAPPVLKETAAPPQQPPGRIPDTYDERELGTSQRLLDTFTFPRAPVPSAPAPEEKKPDDESRLQLESLIRTRFAEYFVYPRMAQSHGWQGEVLLSFRIGPDGTISKIQIVRGSGHAILDQAALDSMRNIERIEFTPGMVLHHVLELHMPVIYHLAQR